MKENDSKTRPPPRSIRIPKRYEAEVDEKWRKSGLSFNEFVLTCILGATHVPQTRGVGVDKDLLTQGVVELTGIKTEMKRIAVKDEGVASAIRRVDDRLIETRNLLMGKAGYKT